jgi:hypothetical protein
VILWGAAGLHGGQRHEAMAGGEPGRWGVALWKSSHAGSGQRRECCSQSAGAVRMQNPESGRSVWRDRRRSEVHCAECVHSLPSR